MGVLPDGTTYLTARGLARVCNLAPSAIIQQGGLWKAGKRDGKLAAWLISKASIDARLDSLYIETTVNGTRTHAYTDEIATRIIEYYAYEYERQDPEVQKRHRALTRAGLRVFVYTALGYDPAKAAALPWREFHDRVLLVAAPDGYFCIFTESQDLVVGAIKGGLKVDSHTVPDISIGKAWGDHWVKKNLAEKYGERIRHDHNYPEYFPQAASNPQPMWVYPLDALPEFRRWKQRVYVKDKLPAYLAGKVNTGAITAGNAKLLIANATAPKPVLPSGR